MCNCALCMFDETFYELGVCLTYTYFILTNVLCFLYYCRVVSNFKWPTYIQYTYTKAYRKKTYSRSINTYTLSSAAAHQQKLKKKINKLIYCIAKLIHYNSNDPKHGPP